MERLAASGAGAVLLAALLSSSGALLEGARSQLTSAGVDTAGRQDISGSWIELATSPDLGAYGEALVGTGAHLYAISDATATSQPKLWRYDPGSNGWASMGVTDLPAGAFRNGATLTWDGGDRIYALGGARYSDPDRREFYHYSISSDSWSTLAVTPAAQGAGDSATWVGSEKRLYAILGSSSHGTVFSSYDPATDAWAVETAPPAGTDDGCSLAWASDGHLYALRGEFLESSPLRDFWKYDLAAGVWSTLAPIPEIDGVGDGGSLIWVGDLDPRRAGSLFALGGGAPDETPGADFYRYDIASNTWYDGSDIPFPVGNFNGNRLGFAGGAIHYWQGGLSSFPGGGDRLGRFAEFSINPPTHSRVD